MAARKFNKETMQQIKEALNTLIQREERDNPLSDSALSVRLTAQGFPVSKKACRYYRAKAGFAGAPDREKTYRENAK